MQEGKQPLRARLQLLARLTLNAGEDAANQPARLAQLDDGNDRAILVQGNQGPAQIVRLGHRGTPSIDVSDEIAILAARPIASLRWRGLDSNFSYAGAVKLVVALFDAPGCLGRVGSRPSEPAAAEREAQGKIRNHSLTPPQVAKRDPFDQPVNQLTGDELPLIGVRSHAAFLAGTAKFIVRRKTQSNRLDRTRRNGRAALWPLAF